MQHIIVSLVVLIALGFTFGIVFGQTAGTVKILSMSSYIDEIDSLHVVGEVENGTPRAITFTKVTGTFYDSDNKVVGTTFTFTSPYDIASGGKAPFDLVLSEASIPVTQIENYSAQVSYQ